MLWIKSFHIIFVVAWFAWLFYLPRLYVYHTEITAREEAERFKVMERRLFAITTMGAALAVAFGIWLLVDGFWAAFHAAPWLHAKLGLVGLLLAYHAYLYKLMLDFRRDANRHSQLFYRVLNEIPTLLLIAIVILVVVKP